jgi:hypothetical protein
MLVDIGIEIDILLRAIVDSDRRPQFGLFVFECCLNIDIGVVNYREAHLITIMVFGSRPI